MKGYIHSKTSMQCKINNVNKLMHKKRREERRGGEGEKKENSGLCIVLKRKQESTGFETVDTVEGRRANRSNTTEDSSVVARRQRDAELETLNQRESRRPLTRQEKMRQEQLRAANEMEDLGRTSDE